MDIAEKFDAKTLALTGEVLVEASAGAGKTFSLVVLYFRLLLEKSYTPQEIVILTYTRKAVAEIKERLADKLDELIGVLAKRLYGAKQMRAGFGAAFSSFWSAEKIENLYHNKKALAQLHTQLYAARSNIANSPTYTFHAFFLSLFRKWTYTMRSPYYIRHSTVQDDGESNDSYVGEAMQHVLLQTFYHPQKNPYLGYFMVRQWRWEHFYNKLKGFWERSEAEPFSKQETCPALTAYQQLEEKYLVLREALYKEWDNFLATYSLAALAANLLLKRTALPANPPAEVPAEAQAEIEISPNVVSLLLLLDQMKHLRHQPLEIHVEIGRVVEDTLQFLAFLKNKASEQQTFKKAGKAFAILTTAWEVDQARPVTKQEFRKQLTKGKEAILAKDISDEALQQVLPKLISAYINFVALVHEKVLFYEQVYQYFLTQTRAQTKKEVAARRRQAGVMTFGDIISWARPAQQKPSVGQAIQANYKAVMIDEFQDTNGEIYDIVKQYFKDIPFRFYVGDPKQSIYSFQGADIHAYLHMRAHIKASKGRFYTLTTNYRSHKQLVAAINALYGQRKVSADPFRSNGEIKFYPMDAVEKSAAWQTMTPLLSPLSLGQLPPAPRLVLWYFSAIKRTTAERLDDSSHLIIATLLRERRRYQRHVSGHTRLAATSSAQPFWSKFAILVRTHTEAKRILTCLQKVQIPVQFSKEKSSRPFTTRAPQDLYQFLQAVYTTYTVKSAMQLNNSAGHSLHALAHKTHLQRILMHYTQATARQTYLRAILLHPMCYSSYGRYSIWAQQTALLDDWLGTFKVLWHREGCLSVLQTFLRQPLPYLKETSTVDFNKNSPPLANSLAEETGLDSPQEHKTPLMCLVDYFASADDARRYLREWTALSVALAQDELALSGFPPQVLLTLLGVLLDPQQEKRTANLALLKKETDITQFASEDFTSILTHMDTQDASGMDWEEWSRQYFTMAKSSQPSTKKDAPYSASLAELGHEGAVQLHTMHSSKGLEFDVVFLPTLMEESAAIPTKDKFLYKPFKRVGEGVAQEKGEWLIDWKQAEPSLAAIAAAESENRRLIYVALTRARERVFASVYVKSKATRKNRNSSCAFTELLSDRQLTAGMSEERLSDFPPQLIKVADANQCLLQQALANDAHNDNFSSHTTSLAPQRQREQKLVDFAHICHVRTREAVFSLPRKAQGYSTSFTRLNRLNMFKNMNLLAAGRASEDVPPGAKDIPRALPAQQTEMAATLEYRNERLLVDEWEETAQQKSQLSQLSQLAYEANENAAPLDTTAEDAFAEEMAATLHSIKLAPTYEENTVASNLEPILTPAADDVWHEEAREEIGTNAASHDMEQTARLLSKELGENGEKLEAGADLWVGGTTASTRLPAGGAGGKELGQFFHALLENSHFNLADPAAAAAFDEKLTALLHKYRKLLPYRDAIMHHVQLIFNVPISLPRVDKKNAPVTALAEQRGKNIPDKPTAVIGLKNLLRSQCIFEMEFVLPTACSERALARELDALWRAEAGVFSSQATASSTKDRARDHKIPNKQQDEVLQLTTYPSQAPAATNEHLASSSAFLSMFEERKKHIFKFEAGFVHGFIDLCFYNAGRYYILDWKTNDLARDRVLPAQYGVAEEDLYGKTHLQAVMHEYAYSLQYYIYWLALHRYLAQQLGKKYFPEQHLGGVIYLFVRGVDEQGHKGVFTTRPSAQTLAKLDKLFTASAPALAPPPTSIPTVARSPH